MGDPGPTFDDAPLKLDRAREHLGELNAQISSYFASRPYTTFREWADPPTEPMIRGITLTREPPPTIALVLGDAIQNLRASLDYMVYELVVASGVRPTTSTEFPICISRESWDAAQGKLRRGKLPTAAVPVIEKLQPFQGPQPPDRHPLWLLHELSNVDKHRRLHLTTLHAAGLDKFDWAIGVDLYRGLGLQTRDPGQGAGIARSFILDHAVPGDADMAESLKGSLFVVLDEAGRREFAPPVDYLVRGIVEFIEDVVSPRLRAC